MQPFWMWSGWTWFWVVWLTIGAVVEFVALFNSGKLDTLSEQVWAVRNNLPPGWASLTLFLGIAVAAWVVYHFAVEGSRPS